MKKYTALFFIIFFISIISAPTVLLSMDKKIDASVLLDNSEEEEKEGVKLLFEFTFENFEEVAFDQINSNSDEYAFKSYSKPHLNLISPPPKKYFA